MLQLVPCPSCGKQSCIAADTSLEATLGCPHCHQQMLLGELLLSQFASWEILNDPATATASSAGETTDEMLNESSAESTLMLDQPVVIPVPESSATDSELKLAQEFYESPPLTIEVSDSSRSSIHHRRRRPSKSPLWQLVPIVLGGLGALPISLLILWYFLGKDIGGLGPRVAEYAPWIVPERFHGRSQRLASTPKKTSAISKIAEVHDSPSANSNVAPAVTSPTSVAGKIQADSSSKIAPEIALDTGIDKQDLLTKIQRSVNTLIYLQAAMKAELPERKELLLSFYDQLSAITHGLEDLENSLPLDPTIHSQLQLLTDSIVLDTAIQTVLNRLTERKLAESTGGLSSAFAFVFDVQQVEQSDDRWLITTKQQGIIDLIIEAPKSIAPSVSEHPRWFVLGTLQSGVDGQPPQPCTFRARYMRGM